MTRWKTRITGLLAFTGWYATCSHLVNLPTWNATQSPYRGPLILISSLAIWIPIQRWIEGHPTETHPARCPATLDLGTSTGWPSGWPPSDHIHRCGYPALKPEHAQVNGIAGHRCTCGTQWTEHINEENADAR